MPFLHHHLRTPRGGPRASDVGALAVLGLGLALTLLSGLGLIGCGVLVRADLLDVQSLSPSVVLPGNRVTISGRGLPVGSQALLTLRGVLSTPLRPHAEVELVWPAQIVSATRAEVVVTEASLPEALEGGRGTFVGTAELSVAMAEGEGRVVGELPDTTIDFLPDRTGSSEGPLAALGLTLTETDAGAFIVDEIAPPATRYGVRVGDELVAIGGVTVLSGRDIVDRSELSGELSVRRDGVVLTLGPRVARRRPDETLRSFQLAALLIVLLLVLRGRPEPPAMPARRVLVGYGLLGAALVASHVALTQLSLDRFAQLLAPAAFVVALTSSLRVAVAGAEGARGLLGVAGGLLRAFCLLFAVASVVLAHDLSDLAELVASQDASPLNYPLFATPVAPALFILLGAAMPDGGDKRGALALFGELAVLVVALECLVGGHAGSGALAAAGYAGRGIVLCLLLRGTSHWLAELPRAGRLSTIALAALLTLLPLVLADLDLGWAALPRASAEVWLVAILMIGLSLAVARRDARAGLELDL